MSLNHVTDPEFLEKTILSSPLEATLTVANSPEARQSGDLANPDGGSVSRCYASYVLTARQSAFVREYPIDMVGAAAAVRAGYSPRSAKVTASRLLAHPEVKVALGEAMAKQAAAADVKAADVVARLRGIGMSDPGVTWTGSDVIKALELLGKYLGMWTEKVDHTSGGMTLEQIVLLADKKYQEAKVAGRPLLAAVGVVDGKPAFVEDPYACQQRPSAGATVELAPEAPAAPTASPAPTPVAPEPAPR